ncbi:MAG: quinolinate synthase NadA [Dehalococcoidia bacterium]|nr:quinolinate synthase NadA [Dehalococcoidia bacterium]
MATTIREPIIPITEIEHSAFCRTDESLASKPLAEELKANIRWQKLPREYMGMKPEVLYPRIRAAKEKLGKRAVILGHHYQREDIIQFADFKGDSFMLSQNAARQKEADFIVFCGVHFMAETADILSGPRQQVVLPNINAGCSMADMAPTDDVLDAWDELSQVAGSGLIPVTYMNSTAAIKAMCGRNGGIVCTSSNAAAVMRWAFERGDKVFFLPDQHLGRNSGVKVGIPLEEMAVWNPFKPLGGLSRSQIQQSKVILWQGHCAVHTRFTVAQIEEARRRFPSVKVVVHPECTREVVEAADMDGSTEFIVRTVTQAPPGSVIAIGTEINLVSRLAHENPDKTVFCLDPVICPCSTMYRIHPAYLAWVLEELVAGRVLNRVSVDEETARYARIALERMLAVV